MTPQRRRRNGHRDWAIFTAGVIILVWELAVDHGANPTWGLIGAGMMGYKFVPERNGV